MAPNAEINWISLNRAGRQASRERSSLLLRVKIAIPGTRNSWRQQLIPVTCPGCACTAASFQQRGQQQLQLGMGKTTQKNAGKQPKRHEKMIQKDAGKRPQKMQENDPKRCRKTTQKRWRKATQKMQENDPQNDAGK